MSLGSTAQVALLPAIQRLLARALRRVPSMTVHHRERLAGYMALVLRTLRLPTGVVSTILYALQAAPLLSHAIENAAPLNLLPSVDYITATDARSTCWVIAKPRFRLAWPSTLGTASIHLAEMAAALWALVTARHSGARHPLIATDNIVVAYNLARRRISLSMAAFFLSRVEQLPFHLVYLPTDFNPVDAPSSLTTDGATSSGRRANCLYGSYTSVSRIEIFSGEGPAAAHDWDRPP